MFGTTAFAQAPFGAVNRQYQVVCAVVGYLNLGSINNFALNRCAINSSDSYTGTLSVVSMLRNMGKVFTVASTTTTAFIKSVLLIKNVTSSSTASLIKFVNKIINSGADITTSVLTEIAIHLVSVSYVVTTTASLFKTIKKTFSFTSTSSASIKFTRFVLLVTTVYTSVVSYFYKVLPNIVDTLFVPTKKVAVKVAGFVSILVRPKKTNVVASKQDDIYG